MNFDGQLYTVSFDRDTLVDTNSQEFFVYLKQGFYQMMRKVTFEQIGRFSFEPSRSILMAHHKLEMWPGFDFRLSTKESGTFLNIEPCYKVVR